MKKTLLISLIIYSLNLWAIVSCEKANISVQVLGSGGPELTNNRASSSYLVWLDDKAIILVDTGGGSSLRYGQSLAKWSDLKAVLFSHFHADHSSDFPAFIKASWFGERVDNLDVFGPFGNSFMPSTKEFIDALFSIENGAYQYLSDMYDDKESDQYKLIAHTVKDSFKTTQIYSSQDLSINAQQVKHGPIPSFAYAVKICDKTIVFSGDTNGKGFENLSISKTDLFIAHNAIAEIAGKVAQSLHMRPSQIGQIAKQINTKKLILSHRMNRSLGKEEKTTKEIRKNYSGELVFANDLDIFIIQESPSSNSSASK